MEALASWFNKVSAIFGTMDGMKKQILTFLLMLVVASGLVAQTILGLDVSHYQGTINWAQVSAAGKVFAYAKATEGVTYTDPNYTTYMTGGTAAGVVMGAYHFARPISNSAINEANHFLAVAGSTIAAGNLPPALDLEDPSGGPSLISSFTSAALTAWAQQWMSTVQTQTGIAPIIYTSASIAAYLNSSINGYKLWIANPNTSATTPPANIGVWTNWAIKQYSWTGTVSGITGAVDLDVFNGSVSDFNTLIGNSACAAPANDNCPGTLITSNGTCLTGTVACATGSYGANQCAGCTCTSPDDKDVYYRFAAAATSETVTLSNYAANFDAVMELRTGCAFNTALGCYDPAGAPATVSKTWNNLTIGQTYYIRIFEYDYSGTPPTSSTFDICVTHVVCLPPTNISFSGNLSVCNGDSSPISVSASNCTGCSFQWSNGLGSGSSKTLAAGNYIVTATNNCGASASGSVSVSTLPGPGLPTFSPASGCSPVTVTVVSTNCDSCSYQWNNGSTKDTSTFISSNNFSVTATDNHSCSASASGSVMVNGQPSISILPAGAGFCAGDSITLSTNPTASAYAWSGPNSFTSSASQIVVNVAGVYSVTATNPGSCTGTITASTTVFPFSSPVADAGINQINTGAGVTIGGNPTATGGQSPYSYAWTPTISLDNASAANPVASPVLETNYTVVVSDNNHCTASASVVVSAQINCIPVADFAASYTTGLAAFTVNFSDSSTNTPTQWDWIFNGGNPPTASIQNPVVVYNTAGVYDVSLKTTNACGADSMAKTQYIHVLATGMDVVSNFTSLSVFPNPNKGIFTLKMESESNQKVSMNLINSLAQTILRREIVTNSKLTETDFDLSERAKGIYYLQILSNGHYSYLKVLVE